MNEPAEEPISQTLEEALEKYSISMEGYQIEMLRDYCELLWQWNQRMNLTRHTDYDRFVSRDLVDTLELADLIDTGLEVLDFGTGGGVPGVPLAIIRPDLQVSLCESVGKKASAVDDMVQKVLACHISLPQQSITV